MESFKRLSSFDQLKILSDPHRLAILKHLMARPATLSQLGRSLGEEPSWVRHHLNMLISAILVELYEVKVNDGYIEKYYQARARAYLVQQILLPETRGKKMVVLSGSHDLALERLAAFAGDDLDIVTLPVGSLDGLVALRQGMCNATGCHLYDSGSGDFNSPFVRHLFPDQAMVLLTLAFREQGLIVEPGNPHKVHGLEDLARNLRFINRNRGSGTRIWLDEQLHRLGISSAEIEGYTDEVNTHTEVAAMINQGHAQVGLGLHAAAVAYSLDFVPLFSERYDLVIPETYFKDRTISPLFDKFYSGEFRQNIANLVGYDVAHLGDQIIV